jgi:hypothetical protein
MFSGSANVSGESISGSALTMAWYCAVRSGAGHEHIALVQARRAPLTWAKSPPAGSSTLGAKRRARLSTSGLKNLRMRMRANLSACLRRHAAARAPVEVGDQHAVVLVVVDAATVDCVLQETPDGRPGDVVCGTDERTYTRESEIEQQRERDRETERDAVTTERGRTMGLPRTCAGSLGADHVDDVRARAQVRVAELVRFGPACARSPVVLATREQPHAAPPCGT